MSKYEKEFKQEAILDCAMEKTLIKLKWPEVQELSGSSFEANLQPYKKRIQAPLTWRGNTPPSLKVSATRKAITEYQKAARDEEGTLELRLFYLDCVVECFTDFGISDEAYVNSIDTALSNFMDGLKKANSARLYEKFEKQFKSLTTKYKNWGWVVDDNLENAYEEFDEDWSKAEFPQKLDMNIILPPQVMYYDGGEIPEDNGVSGFVIIAESHIAVHTFAAKRFFTLDIFSCKPFEIEKAIKFIGDFFKPQYCEHKVFERGREFPRSIGRAAHIVGSERAQLQRELAEV